MANRMVDVRPATTPARALEQRSFALVADKLPLFRLSRAGIGRSTAKTATSQSRADEVVAPAAEEIATGITVGTDLLRVFNTWQSAPACGLKKCLDMEASAPSSHHTDLLIAAQQGWQWRWQSKVSKEISRRL
jgi:hypothetical protein